MCETSPTGQALCVDRVRVCDGTDDCPGGQDELSCSKSNPLPPCAKRVIFKKKKKRATPFNTNQTKRHKLSLTVSYKMYHCKYYKILKYIVLCFKISNIKTI